jgi:tetratricopeptide (TPR) repeat protein
MSRQPNRKQKSTPKRKVTPTRRTKAASSQTISNRSGGTDIKAGQVNIDGDVVGRDKVLNTRHIETGGGAYVGGNVTVAAGGEFVGRDKIVQHITQAAPAVGIVSLHQLPSSPRDFTGRAAELAEVLSTIESGAIITGLRGMGGIGKTALALVLADQLKGKYPDAQFYLDLRGASDKPVPPIEAMQHVIRGYHPTAKLPDDPNDIAALYRSVLDGQRALLLMDNTKDAEQIKPLLPPASCLMLITSRQKFSVQGMRDPIDLNTLLPNDARALLLTIAKRIGDFADEIAKLCGYLPLALQVSASTLAERIDLQPQDFIHRLSDTQQRLQLTGVEASLQLSYDLLTPELKQTFSQLSVFPASFDAPAEEAVCEDTDHLRLSELVRLSLVQYDETTLRYQLHDLVRLFVDKQLNDQERATSQYRHAEHYKNVLNTADELYTQGNENIIHGLALFDLDWINIQAGQKWAADHFQQTKVARFCNTYATSEILMLRLHQRELIQWLEAALHATRVLKDRRFEGAHLSNLGNAYDNLGETRKAIEYNEQALIITREIGDRRGEGYALSNLGKAYDNLGETRKAIEFYERRLIIARETGDRRGEGYALGNLGYAYNNLGETRKAIEYHEQGLIITREIGDRHSEGYALGNLGNAYDNLGETRKAIEYHEQALIITREIGDRRGEGNTLGHLGSAYLLSEVRKAIEFYEQALKIDREISDRGGEGADFGNLGIAYYLLGETRKAIEYHEQALIIAREIGNRRVEGNALGNLGSAYDNLGETRKAIEYHEQALIITREIGDRRGEGIVLWNMSLAFDKLGERKQAITCAAASLKIKDEIESPSREEVRKQLAEWRKDSDQSIS